MNRLYFYKQYKLRVSSTRVIVENSQGFIRTYYFTGRVKGETKESVVRYLKRLGVL